MKTLNTIENVRLSTTANIYFDGKCVSYAIETADGASKSVGVIFPGKLTFSTAAPERMEVVGGACRVLKAGEIDWVDYSAGQAFSVPGESSFDIEVSETLHYVCHYDKQ